ncbi:MAG: CPBP family intramembrane glutamic endopeptidase [Bacteroidota bacterium]
MPDDLIRLTKSQISIIRSRLKQDGIKTAELVEDLLDHFCVAIEEKMAEGRTFNVAIDDAFGSLQEDELKATEMKTQELLEGKKVFYPDLFQSFLLVLSALFIGWLVFFAVQAVAIGIEDLELREQWFEQNHLLIFEISTVLIFGVPIGYAIWKKRQMQSSASVFSFRSVPIYVYGILLLIATFSCFWLEPLHLFIPLFREGQEAEFAVREEFNPLLGIAVGTGNMILMELPSRGIILKGLLMTMTPLRAIFWSSLLSALLVYPYFTSIFFLSWILGWLYWKTRSLYPSIFILIAIPVISYILAQNISALSKSYISWWNYVDHNLLIYLPLVIGSLLLTVGLLYYLNRRLSVESTT